MSAGIGQGSETRFYQTEHGVLGSEEFVDSMIHRIGEFVPKGSPRTLMVEFDPNALVSAVEHVLGLKRSLIFGSGRSAQAVLAKEALVVSGRSVGAGVKALADLTGLSISAVSRRHDAAVKKIRSGHPLADEIAQIVEVYQTCQETRITQA